MMLKECKKKSMLFFTAHYKRATKLIKIIICSDCNIYAPIKMPPNILTNATEAICGEGTLEITGAYDKDNLP